MVARALREIREEIEELERQKARLLEEIEDLKAKVWEKRDNLRDEVEMLQREVEAFRELLAAHES